MVPSKNFWLLLFFVFGVIVPTQLIAEGAVEILDEVGISIFGLELDWRRARAVDEFDDLELHRTVFFSKTNADMSGVDEIYLIRELNHTLSDPKDESAVCTTALQRTLLHIITHRRR